MSLGFSSQQLPVMSSSGVNRTGCKRFLFETCSKNNFKHFFNYLTFKTLLIPLSSVNSILKRGVNK